MALLGIDIGGTKIAFALFDDEGNISVKEILAIGNRRGTEVGNIITVTAALMLAQAGSNGDPVEAIGISVPGISRQGKGTVWAPNIPGWDDYPLMKEVKNSGRAFACQSLPVTGYAIYQVKAGREMPGDAGMRYFWLLVRE